MPELQSLKLVICISSPISSVQTITRRVAVFILPLLETVCFADFPYFIAKN